MKLTNYLYGDEKYLCFPESKYCHLEQVSLALAFPLQRLWFMLVNKE